MAEIADVLLAELDRLKLELQAERTGIETKLKEIEAQKLAAKVALQASIDAHKRTLDYSVGDPATPNCPRCWANGTVTQLRFVNADADDIMRCRVCAISIHLPDD